MKYLKPTLDTMTLQPAELIAVSIEFGGTTESMLSSLSGLGSETYDDEQQSEYANSWR